MSAFDPERKWVPARYLDRKVISVSFVPAKNVNLDLTFPFRLFIVRLLPLRLFELLPRLANLKRCNKLKF
jgi:hypothetical protein